MFTEAQSLAAVDGGFQNQSEYGSQRDSVLTACFGLNEQQTSGGVGSKERKPPDELHKESGDGFSSGIEVALSDGTKLRRRR